MRRPARAARSASCASAISSWSRSPRRCRSTADILIMDEPTSALTEAEVARLYRVIDRLRKRGVTILYISHKMDEVFRLADRITVLRDGRHRAARSTAARRTPREITHLMVGREIEAIDLGEPRQPGDVVLRGRRTSRSPGPGTPAAGGLQDVSFQLRRGEILGIAGLMGAGRTELLECLFGAVPTRRTGAILLDGQRRRVSPSGRSRCAPASRW